MPGVWVEDQNRGGKALAAALLGRPFTDRQFMLVVDPNWDTERNGGSANHDMMANCAALWYDTYKGRWIDSWMVFFANEKRKFQRSEPWSVIYSGWHLLPVLGVHRWAVVHGESALRYEARYWLRNWWSLCALMSTEVGGRPLVNLTGARSMGSPADAWYSHRNAWCEALGKSWPDRGVPTDKRNGWCNEAVPALQPDILETSEPFVRWAQSGSWDAIIQGSPKFGMRGSGHLIRTEEGPACWLERDINNNTGGVLAMRTVRGRVSTLPPNGGPHWRSRTGGTCFADNMGILHYSSDYPEIGAHVLSLPQGDALFYVSIDEDGWKDRLAKPKPEPEPAPDPKPPVYKPKRKSNNDAKAAIGILGLIALIASFFRKKEEK